MGGIFPGEGGHGNIDHAHLGAIAVSDHDLVTFLNEVCNGTNRMFDSSHLFGQVFAQGVAAQSDPKALTHDR